MTNRFDVRYSSSASAALPTLGEYNRLVEPHRDLAQAGAVRHSVGTRGHLKASPSHPLGEEA